MKAILGIFAFLVFILVANIVSLFAVDFATAARIGAYLLLWGAVLAFIFYCGDNSILSISDTWPLFLVTLLACFLPALDYHATQRVPSFITENRNAYLPWWGVWYWQSLVFALVTASSYFAKQKIEDRY